jgi:predicted GNAT family N-acyltransferase
LTIVRTARDEDELAAALALRHAVFVLEQGVPVEEEQDGRDGEALQLVALDGPRLIGTCRVLEHAGAAKLGRMAVAAEQRGRGVASLLLDEAEARARARGASRMVLDAQIGAQSFYERAGYVARGERFLDAGIEHVRMEKALV